MASHVVVVDSTARRATIRTSPEKYLTEVLEEACQKLGRDANSYTLKHNTKTLDLSLTFRLSGLVSGAKLELILSSRSPSVVSVALQLPQPDSQGSSRLTDRLPSNTTLWMVLRHFESGADGEKRNFTGRGVPVSTSQDSTPGRLYYETPIVQIMNREFSSLTNLQKTLAQLGFNSGSTLLRLRYKVTDIPLEDAMHQISQYLNESGDTAKSKSSEAATDSTLQEERVHLIQPSANNQSSMTGEADGSESDGEAKKPLTVVEDHTLDSKPIISSPIPNDNTTRAVTILSAPTSNTPQAAQEEFDERDFVPTIDHAKSHQSRLSAAGANKRLLSDVELQAQAEEQRRRYQNIQELEIKLRFPDQMQSVCKFRKDDSANMLYVFVKGLMAREDEPFVLRYNTPNGSRSIPQGPQGDIKLIEGLGLVGRVLVNVVWGEGASMEARRAPVLKDRYREEAQEFQIKKIEGTAEESQPPLVSTSKPKDEKERKGGIPKWLRLPGKK